MDKSPAPALDVTGIAARMPHRYPFLLLDRVTEQSPGRCVALKNVTMDECFFTGHFPDFPIMPGCLLMEALAQAGNFFGRPEGGGEEAEKRVKEAFLLSSEIKFLKPVTPGDQLIITARLLSKARGVVRYKSDGHVAGELVASGRFMAMVKEEDA